MKKPVRADVSFAEELIIQRFVADMNLQPAISMKVFRMYVTHAKIRNFVIRIDIFTVQNMRRLLYADEDLKADKDFGLQMSS